MSAIGAWLLDCFSALALRLNTNKMPSLITCLTGHAAEINKLPLAAHYHRLVARRGQAKGTVAVAHTLLVIVYHLLADPEATYQDLGVRYFDERDRQATIRRSVARLEALGLTVTLLPAASSPKLPTSS